jgi:dTDP-4-amino-4,6-dideoxygalactose transaminase
MVEALVSNADTLGKALAANGIGSRRWWGGGLHRHRLFQQCECHSTKYSDLLADNVIGLPCWRDFPDEQIRRVCEVILSVIR